MFGNNRINSIEIFPQLFGKYDSIEKYPGDLLELVSSYIKENKITIRIYAETEFMEKVYKICDKYNIRCQRYAS